jgi:predicted dehydrogenase
MTRPLTAVVVGAGVGGRLSINALLNSTAYELIGIADTDPAARTRIADETGVATYPNAEELFTSRPADVACISTHAPSHLPLVRLALERLRPRGLLVEKPLGDTVDAGHEIRNLLRDVPVVVPHGLMERAAAQEVVEKVRSGAVGALRVVEVECTRWDIINAGIHWLQFFVELVRPALVESVLTATDRSTRTFRDGMQVETDAITLALTDSGVRLLMHTGDDVPLPRGGVDCIMRMIGDEGYLEYGAHEDFYVVVTGDHPRQRIDLTPHAESPHQRHLEHLAAQIATGDRDDRIPRSSLHALEIVTAAYESGRRGGIVRLPLAGAQPDLPSDWDPGRPYSGSGGGRDGRKLP